MFGLSGRRIAKLAPAIAVAALVLPATAFGQATRTWVSGVGDDANPCSRTAPCKTFAGAISKTATGGEINAIDPGGFGGVTITKSITIDGSNTEAGVLVSGTNAIVVNAPVGSKVVLRGLDINGLGTGLNGVRMIAGSSLRIEDSRIYEFTRDGVDMESSTPNALLVVTNTAIFNNGGDGVLVAPPTAGNPNKTKVLRSWIQDNACGVVTTSFGPDPAFAFGTNCGTASSASGVNSAAAMTVFDSSIAFNLGSGIFSRGGGSFMRFGRNEVSGNAFGLRTIDGGLLISLTGNLVAGNGTDGAPTSTVVPV
ncbi:MAG: hypothetical protein QOH02_56 [Gaiellaceae bacterium]|jgi:hypothetical protein|nr:hypothetical protein [Gaiellaceae bacterium]MDX6492121.1 hypothetical protein [Gaiellaceae bacterium]MDX6517745.1 hypothetical protein [Gaiellaceae bacterium]